MYITTEPYLFMRRSLLCTAGAACSSGSVRACCWHAVCYMTASKRYGTTSTIVAHPTAVQLLYTVDLVDASGIFFSFFNKWGGCSSTISPLLMIQSSRLSQNSPVGRVRWRSRRRSARPLWRLWRRGERSPLRCGALLADTRQCDRLSGSLLPASGKSRGWYHLHRGGKSDAQRNGLSEAVTASRIGV